MVLYESMNRTHKTEIGLRKYRPHVTFDEVVYNVIGTLGLNYRENELKVISEMNKKMEALDHYRAKKVMDATMTAFENNMKFDLLDTESSTLKYFYETAMMSLYDREHGKTKTAVLDGMNSSFRGKGIALVAVLKPQVKSLYLKFFLFNIHPSIFMDDMVSKIKKNPSIRKGFNSGDVRGVVLRDCNGKVLISELSQTYGAKDHMDKLMHYVNSERSNNIGQNMLNYCILDVIINKDIIPIDLKATPISTLDDSDKNSYLLKGFIDHLNGDGFLLDPREYMNDIADILDDSKTIQ